MTNPFTTVCPERVDRLVLVLGDQLDRPAPHLRDLDPTRDVLLMVEVAREAEHVPSHRQRTVLFLSAMRHFALDQVEAGMSVRYIRLDDVENTQSFGGEIERAIDRLNPELICVVEPGEHRVAREIRHACEAKGVPLEILPDERFTCSPEEFEAWAEGRKSLVMEYFYRERRRKIDVLVEKGKPVGGQWNFDKENRKAFRKAPEIPRPYFARPDDVTKQVMELVESRFPDAPGRMDHFRWPVTGDEAQRALRDFIENRLSGFGTYEDAMWAGEPVLYHSRLSAALNLGLLGPRECIDAALEAYENGLAALNDVEAFVRQIIGWREFIRAIYFREGEGYSSRNALEQRGKLPAFYWSGKTEMACLHHCVDEVLENAWGHHIPRLMVLGNFALIAGVDPGAVNEWFLGMYVDAIDWVTAPNVVGMSQHADGGVVGTKPYAGSGKYIQRMSNYCDGCRYDPKQRSGPDACPFNVFYWDFLFRHGERFGGNQRMTMMLKNAERIDSSERDQIEEDARRLRDEFGID